MKKLLASSVQVCCCCDPKPKILNPLRSPKGAPSGTRSGVLLFDRAVGFCSRGGQLRFRIGVVLLDLGFRLLSSRASFSV